MLKQLSFSDKNLILDFKILDNMVTFCLFFPWSFDIYVVNGWDEFQLAIIVDRV
jgi:hypothetical protein